jgi:hypothetical protein
MNTYHDRYARFGVLISILVGVAIIAIASQVSFCRTNSQSVIQPMRIDALIEAGYLDYEADGVLLDGVSLNDHFRLLDEGY